MVGEKVRAPQLGYWPDCLGTATILIYVPESIKALPSIVYVKFVPEAMFMVSLIAESELSMRIWAGAVNESARMTPLIMTSPFFGAIK